ncbi:MAG: hypothetical protein SNJ80_16330 [Anaerolinea sp.]
MDNAAYDRATAYLAKLYSLPLMQQQGRQHPVLIYPPDPDQVADVDSVLGRLYDAASPLAIYDYGHLHSLQNSGRTLYNGDTYALHSLETHPLRVHAMPGKYFDMLATCDALDRELSLAASSKLIRLPLRQQLHRALPIAQAGWRGAGRSAALGGACLIVFNQRGEYHALLARRSARNASDVNRLHVMPAFIVQPVRGQWQSEWRFSEHVIREYLEELYGVDEGAPSSAHPARQRLQAMLANGDARLYLTGVAYNLLTLRAEICALLLIHDPTWWAESTAPHSALAFNAHSEAQDGRLITMPITTDEALLADLPQPLYTAMPPQAYAALWLGVKLAREIIGGR